MLLSESGRAIGKPPVALAVKRSLPIWLEAVSTLKSVGSKERESRVDSSSLSLGPLPQHLRPGECAGATYQLLVGCT